MGTVTVEFLGLKGNPWWINIPARVSYRSWCKIFHRGSFYRVRWFQVRKSPTSSLLISVVLLWKLRWKVGLNPKRSLKRGPVGEDMHFSIRVIDWIIYWSILKFDCLLHVFSTSLVQGCNSYNHSACINQIWLLEDTNEQSGLFNGTRLNKSVAFFVVNFQSLCFVPLFLFRNLLNENAQLKYKEKDLLQKLETQQKDYDIKKKNVKNLKS